MDEPADDDERLLSRTRSDPEAFGAFYRRHERSVLGHFMRRIGNAEIAADLTAETFAAALEAADRFRAGGAPASAWLFGIARHKLIRSAERRQVEASARRRIGMAALAIDDDVLRAIEAVGADERASALLDSLPADQAETVHGRVVRGGAVRRAGRPAPLL